MATQHPFAVERKITGHSLHLFLLEWSHENPFTSMLSDKARKALIDDIAENIIYKLPKIESNTNDQENQEVV